MRRTLPLVLLLAACSAAPPASSATFDLDEYEIHSSADTFSSGHIVLEVDNEGEFPHTLVVTRSDGSVVQAIDPLAPGSDESLALDLPPGSYQVSCRIVVQLPNGSIVDHFQHGMYMQIKVVG